MYYRNYGEFRGYNKTQMRGFTSLGLKKRSGKLFGISRWKLLYIDWINNKVLPYSRRNHI